MVSTLCAPGRPLCWRTTPVCMYGYTGWALCLAVAHPRDIFRRYRILYTLFRRSRILGGDPLHILHKVQTPCGNPLHTLYNAPLSCILQQKVRAVQYVHPWYFLDDDCTQNHLRILARVHVLKLTRYNQTRASRAARLRKFARVSPEAYSTIHCRQVSSYVLQQRPTRRKLNSVWPLRPKFVEISEISENTMSSHRVISTRPVYSWVSGTFSQIVNLDFEIYRDSRLYREP